MKNKKVEMSVALFGGSCPTNKFQHLESLTFLYTLTFKSSNWELNKELHFLRENLWL